MGDSGGLFGKDLGEICKTCRRNYMGVSENSGTPKSSILIGFSIKNHPFWCKLCVFSTEIYGAFFPIPTVPATQGHGDGGLCRGGVTTQVAKQCGRCQHKLQVCIERLVAGQITATSHDLTPNGGLVREIPLFQWKSRLVKYSNLTGW